MSRADSIIQFLTDYPRASAYQGNLSTEDMRQVVEQIDRIGDDAWMLGYRDATITEVNAFRNKIIGLINDAPNEEG